MDNFGKKRAGEQCKSSTKKEYNALLNTLVVLPLFSTILLEVPHSAYNGQKKKNNFTFFFFLYRKNNKDISTCIVFSFEQCVVFLNWRNTNFHSTLSVSLGTQSCQIFVTISDSFRDYHI
jgi:hypothetical protein